VRRSGAANPGGLSNRLRVWLDLTAGTRLAVNRLSQSPGARSYPEQGVTCGAWDPIPSVIAPRRSFLPRGAWESRDRVANLVPPAPREQNAGQSAGLATARHLVKWGPVRSPVSSAGSAPFLVERKPGKSEASLEMRGRTRRTHLGGSLRESRLTAACPASQSVNPLTPLRYRWPRVERFGRASATMPQKLLAAFSPPRRRPLLSGCCRQCSLN